MALKDLIEEAMTKGKDLKDDLLSELLHSKVVSDMAQSDLLMKGLTHILQTKEEVSHVLKKKMQHVFQLMDVPSRNDLSRIEQKLDHLEKTIDRVGKKAITVKSLKKIQTTKNHSRKASL